MKKTEVCFSKVKNDYLRFLNKEKVFNIEDVQIQGVLSGLIRKYN